MAEMDTRALVTELYRAYGDGDGETLSRLVHDDIEWHIHSPPDVFPFAGPRRGKAAVLEVLGQIGGANQIERYEPKIVVVDGDQAAVLSEVEMVQRETGRRLSFLLANFLRFADGKVVLFHELSDTLDVAQQATGQRLAFPAVPT